MNILFLTLLSQSCLEQVRRATALPVKKCQLVGVWPMLCSCLHSTWHGAAPSWQMLKARWMHELQKSHVLTGVSELTSTVVPGEAV